ncbi:formylglycine-generating enzyme family protein [Pirellulaceae bacterium SH501]
MPKPTSHSQKPKPQISSSGSSTLLRWGISSGALIAFGLTAFLAWRQFQNSEQSGEPKQSGVARAELQRDQAEAIQAASFFPTIENKASEPGSTPSGMKWIPGGEFSMGCEAKNESLCGTPGTTMDTVPIHRVYVDGFWMDETEVTNAQFRAFVEATGYVTIAERKPTPEELPGVPEELLVAGSAVFQPTDAAVPLDQFLQWWKYVPGACWKHPLGPESNLEGLDQFPVVHIAYEDAEAYAKWAGKRLPTEAEWEFAARGGKAGDLYTWGNTARIQDRYFANYYQGAFPIRDGDAASDGHAGIAPVKQYEPNAYGLYDMSGNVWEWISDWYREDYYSTLKATGKVAVNPTGPADSFDPQEPGQPKRVHRGGSFLCSDSYCNRYLLGTRGKGEIRSTSNHVGFRCVKVPEK